MLSRTFIALAGISMTMSAYAHTPLTPHTAEYQVNYGDIELGKARYQLPPSDNGVFNYRFDSALSLLLLSDIRHITSVFTQEGAELQPMRYLQEREGTGPDFREQSAFVKDQGVVHTRYKDEKGKLPYEGKLFDPLMVQLQFRLDLAAGKTDEMHYEMVKDNEIDEYDFRIVGNEKMTIDSGSYDTVKIEVVRDSKKRQTFFWMAPDLSYLPVRLTHFEKGDKQLDIKLLSYHFSDSDTGVLPPMEAPTAVPGNDKPAIDDVKAAELASELEQTLTESK